MPGQTLLGALLVTLLVLSADGASIALGGVHSCALSFAVTNSTMKCWGQNSKGELGDGTTFNRRTPGVVSGITTATSIALGGHHSCALLTDGTIQCWGQNSLGDLGDGTTTNRLSPPWRCQASRRRQASLWVATTRVPC